MSLVGESEFNAWSLLSLAATAHGAPAYPDELGVSYVYNTNVSNGRYIRVGDLAVIRDDQYVLGAGWIDSIYTAPGRKIRLRCPNCRRTDFKLRLTRKPRYRCANCTEEFDIADEEELNVEVFTADYSRTWRLADVPFPANLIKPAYVTRAEQHAIRQLDVERVRPLLGAHLVLGEPWWGTFVREDTRIPGGHGTAISKTRLGQQRFREAMLDRFGEVCAFTGPQPPGALEAAHLYLYSKASEHDVKGGLILRCDLHALFDRWLITINPDSWTIDVGPTLRPYPSLAALQGRPVQIRPELRPRDKYVRKHAMTSYEAWGARDLVINLLSAALTLRLNRYVWRVTALEFSNAVGRERLRQALAECVTCPNGHQ